MFPFDSTFAQFIFYFVRSVYVQNLKHVSLAISKLFKAIRKFEI